MRRQLPVTLLVQYAVVIALLTLEIAAVAVSGTAAPGAIALWLMQPEVVGAFVGGGLVLTVLFGLMTLAHSYRAIGLLSDGGYFLVRNIGALVLLAFLILGMTFF